jgi:4'-phosphopantetheinyl transferase
LWRANIDLPPADLEKLEGTLISEELARAAQFRFPRDRRDFVAARGVLRDILGRYLKQQPGRLRFCYGFLGKPALAPGYASAQIRFNLSHSDGVALYAMARSREVGVDLERIQPRAVDEDLAERIFSRQEIAAFRALPANARPEAFFNCWTRKEAYLKGRGDGLMVSLDSFAVPLAPGRSDALLDGKDPRWSVQGLTLAPGYVAAIAVEGTNWDLRLWHWTAAQTPERCDLGSLLNSVDEFWKGRPTTGD